MSPTRKNGFYGGIERSFFGRMSGAVAVAMAMFASAAPTVAGAQPTQWSVRLANGPG